MSRHVFFSFDLDHDYARAVRLRDRWVARDRTAGGFREGTDWAGLKGRGREAVETWVRGELEEADVVVVLIGRDTARLYYVDEAVRRAGEAGLGLVGIRVHGMEVPGQGPGMAMAGPDPLRSVVDEGGRRLHRTYDWRPGFTDPFLVDWIELAAKEAGR